MIRLPALLLPFVLVLTGCGAPDSPADLAVKQTHKLVQLSPVTVANNTVSYRFPATVIPVKTVELNFEVSGRLTHVDLKQGHLVKKGTLLASIDSTPFERNVRENRALHKQARLELERVQSLYKKGLSPKRDLDNAETQFEITKVDLENSIQDLSYTELRAPFDALISDRLVEKDNYIITGTAITRLQDVSQAYFEINVSERVLAANINNKILSAVASITGRNNETFPLAYIEHTTSADPVTQTYKVTFSSAQPKDGHLTPGIRAAVDVTVGTDNRAGSLHVPLNALQVNADQSYSVWRFAPTSEDSKRGTVHQVPVEVGEITGHMVTISDGVGPEQFVVSAGVSQMREAMLVEAYEAE
ncbi:efflux RND transporter periplasmic adaptor subunit [Neiella marina]|uniref:Efflux RND transporter periplasmic adaptor subunit n=1 Tax=Neiella holothuriorum TaxID=2870530 RepID=A0ABS7EIZ1_9GAMM|nr:efflux RND transporter periplasmic adaptor subunit [Neiella holothuriorum]MBW8191726.1 efflux RND transporter periplasmic adaptor subunit [Neiella holothuriorum]